MIKTSYRHKNLVGVILKALFCTLIFWLSFVDTRFAWAYRIDTGQISAPSMMRDRADLKYIAEFLEEFIKGLRGLNRQALSEPIERMNRVSELFLTLRPKNQPDFWMQPYLLLDGERAIFVFKDGPNQLKYGSNPIAYGVQFNQHLPSNSGRDLLDLLYIPQEEYLERFRGEERFYLALRAIGHARLFNFGTSVLSALDVIWYQYTEFIERDRRRLNISDEFHKFLKEDIRLVTEATSQFSDKMQLAFRRSREEKIMRKDETELLKESLRQMVLKLREGWELLETNRAIMQDTISQLEKTDEDTLKDFGKSLERYPRLYQEIFEITYSLWAFANGIVPVWRRAISLEEVIRLGFDDPPRTVAIEGSKEGEPNFLNLPYAVREGRRPIRMVIPSHEELKKIPVYGNYRFLAFAIANMLAGANRVTPTDREILFKVSVDDVYIEFTVSDQGNGIPANILWKIPDSDYTTKASGGGTGHAITERVVIKDHGGLVKIDSLPQGTDITVLWPRRLWTDYETEAVQLDIGRSI